MIGKKCRSKKGGATVEWVVGIILVVSVVGSMIFKIADSSSDQGALTQSWIDGVPAPTTP
jgi:hypothetical protein